MNRILCSRRMKACDRREIESRTPSAILMERAAEAIYKILRRDFDMTRILFVCGGGNNGGDGLIAAMLAAENGYEAHVLFLGSENGCTVETSKCLADAKNTNVKFVSTIAEEYSAIVDAMFGIGLSRDIDGRNAEITKRINLSGTPVLAVDIPSGICADNGDILGCAVKATETVAIAAYKRGHILGMGAIYSGKVICVDIGIPCDNAEDFDGEGDLVPIVLEKDDVSLLPKRQRISNKATFGRALIIGGAPGMCGAVYLSALAAYRCGAGLVEIFTSVENRLPLQTLLPEAIVTVSDWDEPDLGALQGAMKRATQICIGCGMGREKGAFDIVSYVYGNAAVPLTVDADALNITSEYDLEFPSRISVTVTPHPLEFARLMDISVEEVKYDFWENAVGYAQDKGVICVAKDTFTAVTDGQDLYVNTSGSPALAKGGSGDVLSGVITGLRCVGMAPLGAAAMGVLVHALAGEMAEEKYGISAPLARETADLLGEVLREAGR